MITRVTYKDVTVQTFRSIKPDGAPQDPVTLFLAGDDWVKDITVYLFNRTNQTIVQGAFNFSFPETTNWSTHFRAVFPLNLGRIPDWALYDHGRAVRQVQGSKQPLSFGPGQIMAIHLGDYIEKIKADVEPTRPLAALTQMEIGLAGFFFTDELEWSGSFRVLDPQTLTWVRKSEFYPGDQDSRWPGRPGWPGQQ